VIRLAIRVPRERAEEVLAELLELAPAGVEEVAADGGAKVEFAVYGSPGEIPTLPDLEAAFAGTLLEISTSELPDDWHERWKDFHRPIVIESPPGATGAEALALRIRPPWEPAAAGSWREVVIDPGQAFGTGAHASTRLCLELLLDALASGEIAGPGPLLDVGAGSGVLAIAAGLLGFAPLLALDNEAESVAAARENAAVNGVALESRRFDLRNDGLPWPAAPGQTLVFANLLRPLLLLLADALDEPPAHLIASGLLQHEADEIADAFAERHGMRERARRVSGDWAALRLQRVA
jgi:ribosomal protein L11 methyltransferase